MSNQSIGYDFKDFQLNPLQRLKKVERAWAGIASVEVLIADSLLNDFSRNFLLVQIVEEAIANVVRYQNSSNIVIRAELIDNGKVKLIVSSDGKASQIGNPGVGTGRLGKREPLWRLSCNILLLGPSEGLRTCRNFLSIQR